MTNQAYMIQVMLASYDLLKKSEYTKEHILKKYKVSFEWGLSDIDQWADEQLLALRDEMLEVGIDESLLFPLYSLFFSLRNNESLSEQIDQEILSALDKSYDYEAQEVFVKLTFDMYRLEKYVRFNKVDEQIPEGYLSIDDFKFYKSVDKILLNSLYHGRVSDLTQENVRAKLLELRHEFMREYVWGLDAHNSIFALIYLRMVEIENIQSFMKANLYGFELREGIYV